MFKMVNDTVVADSKNDIVAGAVLPEGEVLTGRVGCYYEDGNSGWHDSNLRETICITYPDGADLEGNRTRGYCFAELEV